MTPGLDSLARYQVRIEGENVSNGYLAEFYTF